LVGIKSQSKNALGYFCYGCGSVWLDLPPDLDELISLENFAPSGAKIISPFEATQRSVFSFKVLEETMSEGEFLCLSNRSIDEEI